MKKRKKKRTQAVRVLDRQHFRQQQRRWLIIFSTALIFSCVIFWCWKKIHNPNLFPIQVVTIEGSCQHLDKKALKQVIFPYTQSNFFTINMVSLRERLMQIPWVKSVFISREWPNQLRIQLVEQKPVAIWRNNLFLNTEGDLFNASLDAQSLKTAQLPSLYGPSGEQNTVWQTLVKLNYFLTPLHLHIARLELTEQGTWSLELNNGLRLVLGQQDLPTRLERFIKAYPTLTKNNASIDYIDLRYSHGMAVKYHIAVE